MYLQRHGALDGEVVSIPAVHINDQRRNMQMLWRNSFFGIADGHGQLKFSQRADSPPRHIRNFDARVHVHVGGSEMSYCERVPAEINSFETVIHRQL